jgi:hypothetical protein
MDRYRSSAGYGRLAATPEPSADIRVLPVIGTRSGHREAVPALSDNVWGQ